MPDIIDTALNAHAYFQLNRKQAIEIVRDVAAAVSQWEAVSQRYEVRGAIEISNRFGWRNLNFAITVVIMD
ncbi:MAG: hypothetical protein R8K50_00480 [Mariprofundus sp.]